MKLLFELLLLLHLVQLCYCASFFNNLFGNSDSDPPPTSKAPVQKESRSAAKPVQTVPNSTVPLSYETFQQCMDVIKAVEKQLSEWTFTQSSKADKVALMNDTLTKCSASAMNWSDFFQSHNYSTLKKDSDWLCNFLNGDIMNPQYFASFQSSDGAFCKIFDHVQMLGCLKTELLPDLTTGCFNKIEHPFRNFKRKNIKAVNSIPEDVFRLLTPQKDNVDDKSSIMSAIEDFDLNRSNLSSNDIGFQSILQKVGSLSKFHPTGLKNITRSMPIEKMGTPFNDLTQEQLCHFFSGIKSNFNTAWVAQDGGNGKFITMNMFL
jgi:hypothetical protein